MILFLTSNQGKYNEYKTYVPDLKMKNVDLEELQGLDPLKILMHKVSEAEKLGLNEDFFIEDNSLDIVGMKGFPGPLVKYLYLSISPLGMYKFAKALGKTTAINRIYVAAKIGGKLHIIHTSQKGKLVAPRGNLDVGWGKIFQPVGSKKTYGQMTFEKKIPYSPRHKAILKLAKLVK
ncbi:MAG TPA: non-canonical purine NTP pyrophosphatase [Patescibacteria group bacterium]|nr:non-canonical purine NTP pyrophosphatase [Patescibacteria group bacterium]